MENTYVQSQVADAASLLLICQSPDIEILFRLDFCLSYSRLLLSFLYSPQL